MEWLYYIDTSLVLVFSLVLVRVSGIVIVAPVFGGTDVPMRFRVLFAFALAILVMPSQWNVPVDEPPNLIAYVLVIGSELIVGISIGLCLTIFFAGIHFAGALIGQLGGLMAGELLDPTSGEQIPMVSRFLHLLAVAVFACIGGLRALMSALLDTIVTVVSTGFLLGFRIAGPVMAGILVSMIVMGLVSKTLPQLNLMSLGFGLNNILMFILLFASIGAGIYCFQDRVADVMEVIFEGLHVEMNPEWFG